MNGLVEAWVAEVGAKILRGILLAGVAFGAYSYTRYLTVKAEMAEQTAVQARQAIADRDATITQLRALSAAQARFTAQLGQERDGIRGALNSREIQMRKLQDENANIRAWAAGPVPGDVVRLRDHGTLSGAAAYRQFLSGSAALPAARRAGEE